MSPKFSKNAAKTDKTAKTDNTRRAESKPILSCVDIRKSYGSGASAVHALRGINLQVSDGDYLGILGPSGSGKSTLLQILGLLDHPTSGQVILQGLPTHDFNDDRLSQVRGEFIGFVFQSFHLMPRMNLWQNVALPLVYQGVAASERYERAVQALRQVRLESRADHRPHQLSGGERQRGAIARAIVHSPKLLLADEPTGNLDSKVKEEILDHLEELNQDKKMTLVLITHDSETATRTQKTIQIKDGLLVDGGS